MPEFCAFDTPIIELLINDNAPRANYIDESDNTYSSITFELETKNINGKTIFLRLDDNPDNLQGIRPDGEFPLDYVVVKLIGDTSDMTVVPRFTIIPLARELYDNNGIPFSWIDVIITGDYTIVQSDYAWYTDGYYEESIYLHNGNFFIMDGKATTGVNLIGIPTVDKTTMRLHTYLTYSG